MSECKDKPKVFVDYDEYKSLIDFKETVLKDNWRFFVEECYGSKTTYVFKLKSDETNLITELIQQQKEMLKELISLSDENYLLECELDNKKPDPYIMQKKRRDVESKKIWYKFW